MKKEKESKNPFYWLFLSLYILTSSLILIESCLPSYISSVQSDSIGGIITGIINAITTPKEKTPVYPSSISFSFPQDKNLIDVDEAIIGTTKLITYKTNYHEIDTKKEEKRSDLTYEVSKGDKSGLQISLSSSLDSGSLRLIPLKEGDYEITFKSSNFTSSISFSSKKSKEISSSMINYFGEENIELNQNEPSLIKYTYSLSSPNNEEYDYSYLMRFFNEGNPFFSSSDTSIFEIDSNYIIPKEEGVADLLFLGNVISRVKVNSSSISIPATFPSLDNKELHPLDYDYEDECGLPLDSNYPIVYSTNDSLIGKVLNSHYEIDKDKTYKLVGPKVFGYRNLGSLELEARLVGTNTTHVYNLVSKELKSTSFEISPTVNGTKIDLENYEFKVGDMVYLNPSFSPKNATIKRLHVSGDNIEVYNNDSSSPYFRIAYKGKNIISLSVDETNVKEFSLTCVDAPAISKEEQTMVNYSLRKILGHFLLFGFNGIFAALTLFFSRFKDKEDKYYIYPLVILFGFFIALFSEAIQAIPALRRGPSLIDACIDYGGFLSGFIVISIIHLFIILLKKKQDEKRSNESK